MESFSAKNLSGLVLLASLWAWGAPAAAEDAAPETPAAAEDAAPDAPAAGDSGGTADDPASPAAEATPAATPAGPQAAAAPSPTADRGVPEELLRLGRVESVLLANDDPESALEFGAELEGEGHPSARLSLLLGACLMRLGRTEEAATRFRDAVERSQRDESLHLRALYNVARALHAQARHQDAAAAYEAYVAYARAHASLPAFAEEATRISRALRGRAAAPANQR
jgi:tetratricopeptide (TPR) repeat protein